MNELNDQVMRRVRVIYFTRKALGPTAIKIYLLGGVGVLESYYISISEVFVNLENGVTNTQSAFGFAVSALSKTERVSLCLLLVGTGLALLTAKDLLKSSRVSTLAENWRPRFLSRRQGLTV